MTHDPSALITPEHLEHLAIFPLPNATLYPGTRLPLHIFEQRYRVMTAEAIEQDIPVAIVKLKDPPEQDDLGRPAFETIGCAGVLTHYQQLEDGRYNILLEGVCRVEILEEFGPRKPYRVARARKLEDILEPMSALGAMMTTLRGCIMGLQQEHEKMAEAISRTLEQYPSPGEFTNVLSSILIADPELRQRMLEERHVSRRLEDLITRLTELLAISGAPGEKQWLN